MRQHVGIVIPICYSHKFLSWIVLFSCFCPQKILKYLALLFISFPRYAVWVHTVCFSPLSVLEKSEFKDDSQFFRFYADEEMEGTGSKSKQLQRNDFKLIENILAKSLVVSGRARMSWLQENSWDLPEQS